MLTQIEIQNFRLLREVNVPLRPLTVLVGSNNSGKSAFLAALQYLVNGLPFQPWDHWQGNLSEDIVLRGSTPRGTVIRKSRDKSENNPIVGALQPLGFFHLPAQGMPAVSHGHNDDSGPPNLSTTGEGVATVFDYWLRRDRTRFFKALQAIRTLVPGLTDLIISTQHPMERRLDLVIENGLRLQPTLASSGIRLLLVYVALAYHESPPRVILVEEPETGFHPRRLKEVMRLLREITEGKHCGYPAQVILTTHSPYLLDLIDLETDQVLVFRRNEDGSGTAQPADPDRLKVFLDEFLLGEVWYNQGEEGLLPRKQ